MRIDDRHLDEVRERGFTVVEAFLEPDRLAAARAALWGIYPMPEQYFADPAAHSRLAKSQFAGLRYFPYNDPALDALVTHPDLIDAAERLLESEDLDIYKVELWAKYAGAIDYDQPHHRDYGNHSLVVPDDGGAPSAHMTTFMLLSDVDEGCGPTRVVPLPLSRAVPTVPMILAPGTMTEHEVAVTGPAGSLFIYRTDVLHRGSNFTRAGASRFVLSVDFKRRGRAWEGKQAWPDRALHPGWVEAVATMDVRARDLFGFPRPGDPYWTASTIAGVGARYPAMDMAPYRAALPAA